MVVQEWEVPPAAPVDQKLLKDSTPSWQSLLQRIIHSGIRVPKYQYILFVSIGAFLTGVNLTFKKPKKLK